MKANVVDLVELQSKEGFRKHYKLNLVYLPYTQCTPYTASLSVYGEIVRRIRRGHSPYTAIEGLLHSSAQRPLVVHKGPIHHTVARSSKKVL